FSMRNGSGDDLFIIFTEQEVLIKGFAHESPISPYQARPPKVFQGILEGIPESFNRFVDEPAFMFTATTFCLWYVKGIDEWSYSLRPTLDESDLDGSRMLLGIFDGKPETFHQWAS